MTLVTNNVTQPEVSFVILKEAPSMADNTLQETKTKYTEAESIVYLENFDRIRKRAVEIRKFHEGLKQDISWRECVRLASLQLRDD